MSTMILDIETIPLGMFSHRLAHGQAWEGTVPEWAFEAVGPQPMPERGRVPRNWRDPAKIAAREAEIERDYQDALGRMESEHRARAWEYVRAGSLRPDRGRVLCACWRIDRQVGMTMADYEGQMLTEIADAITGHGVSRIVSWGDFDSTFLFGRSIRLGHIALAGMIAEPHYSSTAKLKLYTRPTTVIDAMTLWPLQGGKRGPRLADACAALGIGHGKGNPIDGSQVLDAYMDGREREVLDHCLADVRDLEQVWDALRGVWGIT